MKLFFKYFWSTVGWIYKCRTLGHRGLALLMCATILMNLESIVISGRSGTEGLYIVWFYLYEMSSVHKPRETGESPGFQGLGRRKIAMTADGDRISFVGWWKCSVNDDDCTTLWIYWNPLNYILLTGVFLFDFKFLFIWLCWVLVGIFVASCGIFFLQCTNSLFVTQAPEHV